MNLKSLSYFFLKKLVLSSRSGALVRRITILSFIAISLSLTAFFIVLFVMNGMNRNIKNRILRLEPHLTTLNKADHDPTVLSHVLNSQAVKYQTFDLILRSVDGQFRGAEAVGYDSEGLKYWLSKLKDLKKMRSNGYERDQIVYGFELKENEVAIGIDLARSLKLFEGDELTLIPPETLMLSSLEAPVFQKVIVRRILATDLQDLDAKLLLFNSDSSLKVFAKTLSRRTGFHLWFDSVEKADDVKKILSTNSIQSETWQEKNSEFFFALKMEKLMIGMFLTLAGLIASSSILTVLALLMSQKKRDIAIIKTLGLSQKKTLKLFTKIGLWISGGAITLGTALGVGISLYIQNFPVNILPDIYYDSTIPALVDFGFVAVVICISVLLAFLGSYFPARYTLSIEPAILLRKNN